MMLKNFLFYAFSTFINTWAAEAGGGEVFRVFGIVSLVLIALCIPMCKHRPLLIRDQMYVMSLQVCRHLRQDEPEADVQLVHP
jgi:hypothetical protein